MLPWPVLALIISAVLLAFSWVISVFLHQLKIRRDPFHKYIGPLYVWLELLTRRPCLVLSLGVIVPTYLSWEGLRASDYWIDIDMDFAGYLRAEVPVMWTETAVNEAVRRQKEKVGHRRRRVAPWNEWRFPRSAAARHLTESRTDSLGGDPTKTVVSTQQQTVKFWKLHIFYKDRSPDRTRGMGVFDPLALAEIRAFEQGLSAVSGYSDYCWRKYPASHCNPPDSVTNFFFETTSATRVPGSSAHEQLRHINGILRQFVANKTFWWTDMHFSAHNLTSEYTRAIFRGGAPLAGVEDYSRHSVAKTKLKHRAHLNRIYHEYLTKASFELVTVSWYEQGLFELEILETLKSDSMWAVGSFLMVLTVLLLNLCNFFATFFGVLGVVLSFTTTYYFYFVCMEYKTLSVLDFVSLFLIMGIATDDMLVIYNAYHLVPAMLGKSVDPCERMKHAYREAAAACTVTTATTMASFYANCLSAVSVVKRFGFFMGTLVFWNYVNVMVIFPAAILVNELYIAGPIRRCCWKSSDAETAYLFDATLSGSSVNSSFSAVTRSSTRAVHRVTYTVRSTLRKFSPRITFRGSSCKNLNVEEMSGPERFFYSKLAPFLWNHRRACIIISLCLAGLSAYLFVSNVELASGELQIFSTSQNAGRLFQLMNLVFPMGLDFPTDDSQGDKSTQRLVARESANMGGEASESFHGSTSVFTAMNNSTLSGSDANSSRSNPWSSFGTVGLNPSVATDSAGVGFSDCPSNCSGLGVCKLGECDCPSGYTGFDCSVLEKVPREPLTNCIQVQLVWGVTGYEASNTSSPSFFAQFDLFDASVQNWIFETCQRARNNSWFRVRPEQPCWIEAWRQWVHAAGGVFPIVNRSLASEALQAFLSNSKMRKLGFETDLGTDGEGFSGHVSFVRVRLLIDVAKDAMLDDLASHHKRWTTFVAEWNSQAPPTAGSALLVSSTFSSMLVKQTIIAKTLQAIIASLGITFFSVGIFTGNGLLSFYVSLNIVLVLATLLGILFCVMGYTFGAVEAIGATIFAGLSVDYCVHMTHSYHVSCGLQRNEKTRDALAQVGPSIVGGAATTLSSAAFLFPCKIRLFVQLGTMIFVNSLISLLFTFSFLTPLLNLLGPLDDFGDLSRPIRLVRTALRNNRNSHQPEITARDSETDQRCWDSEAQHLPRLLTTISPAATPPDGEAKWNLEPSPRAGNVDAAGGFVENPSMSSRVSARATTTSKSQDGKALLKLEQASLDPSSRAPKIRSAKTDPAKTFGQPPNPSSLELMKVNTSLKPEDQQACSNLRYIPFTSDGQISNFCVAHADPKQSGGEDPGRLSRAVSFSKASLTSNNSATSQDREGKLNSEQPLSSIFGRASSSRDTNVEATKSVEEDPVTLPIASAESRTFEVSQNRDARSNMQCTPFINHGQTLNSRAAHTGPVGQLEQGAASCGNTPPKFSASAETQNGEAKSISEQPLSNIYGRSSRPTHVEPAGLVREDPSTMPNASAKPSSATAPHDGDARSHMQSAPFTTYGQTTHCRAAHTRLAGQLEDDAGAFSNTFPKSKTSEKSQDVETKRRNSERPRSSSHFRALSSCAAYEDLGEQREAYPCKLSRDSARPKLFAASHDGEKGLHTEKRGRSMEKRGSDGRPAHADIAKQAEQDASSLPKVSRRSKSLPNIKRSCQKLNSRAAKADPVEQVDLDAATLSKASLRSNTSANPQDGEAKRNSELPYFNNHGRALNSCDPHADPAESLDHAAGTSTASLGVSPEVFADVNEGPSSSRRETNEAATTFLKNVNIRNPRSARTSNGLLLECIDIPTGTTPLATDNSDAHSCQVPTAGTSAETAHATFPRRRRAGQVTVLEGTVLPDPSDYTPWTLPTVKVSDLTVQAPASTSRGRESTSGNIYVRPPRRRRQKSAPPVRAQAVVNPARAMGDSAAIGDQTTNLDAESQHSPLPL